MSIDNTLQPVDSTSLPSTNFGKKENGRIISLLVIIMFLTIFLILMMTFVYQIINLPKPVTSHVATDKNLDSTSTPIWEGDKILLPLHYNKPPVEAFEMFFLFSGTINTILESPNGKKIVTDIADPNVPEFLIKPGLKTYVYFFDGKNYKEAEINDLAIGQRILMHMYFLTAHNTWGLHMIYIYE